MSGGLQDVKSLPPSVVIQLRSTREFHDSDLTQSLWRFPHVELG